MSGRYTILARQAGKTLHKYVVDEEDFQAVLSAVKAQLQRGQIDLIDITDHKNGLKCRRIYAPRRKR